MIEVEQIQETLSSHGYDYKKYLGEGSFSNVVLCQSQKYKDYFAVKRAVKNRLTASEYNTLISLIHPNIIRLYDSFDDKEAQYLVMEYCSNGTLFQKGALPYEKFVCYAKEILEALAYCHSLKIAHRDIKPENIFIDKYDHIKLADFGMSKQFEYEGKTKEKCGSLMYIAPEMLRNDEFCPFKADIWALGITFFFMATGRHAFQCTSREELKKMIFFGDLNFLDFPIDQRIRFLITKMTTLDLKSRPTAEKLLKLPMFSSTSTLKSLILTDKSKKHSFSAGYCTPFNLDSVRSGRLDNGFKSADDDIARQVPMSNIHSYRGINLYPQIQRNNRRFHQTKL